MTNPDIQTYMYKVPVGGWVIEVTVGDRKFMTTAFTKWGARRAVAKAKLKDWSLE